MRPITNIDQEHLQTIRIFLSIMSVREVPMGRLPVSLQTLYADMVVNRR